MFKTNYFCILMAIQFGTIAVVEGTLNWLPVDDTEKSKILNSIFDAKVLKEASIVDLRNNLVPELEYNVGTTTGKLVVCKYKPFYFFFAIDNKEAKYKVTRFGRFRELLASEDEKSTRSICQEEAEFYYSWNPYAFKEEWKLVESEEHYNVFENRRHRLGTNYILLRIWYLPNSTNQLAIYQIGSHFRFLALSYFDEENRLSNIKHYGTKFGQQWEVEEEIAAYLITVQPFLGDAFRNLKDVELEFGQSIGRKLQQFTTDLQSRLDKEVKLSIELALPAEENGGKFFLVLDSPKLEEPILVGAEGVMNRNPTLMHFSQFERSRNPMDIVGNYCTIALTSNFRQIEEEWQWHWDLDNHPLFSQFAVLLDEFDLRVVAAAPFTPQDNKVFFQKIRLVEGNYMIAIYSCMGKLFLVTIGDDPINKDCINLKHVGALGNEKELLLDYKRYTDSEFKFKDSVFENGMGILGLNLPQEVQCNLKSIFTAVKSSLESNSGAWESVNSESYVDWIQECNYIPPPHYNTPVELTWFAILCKVNITVQSPETQNMVQKLQNTETKYLYTVATFHGKVYQATYTGKGFHSSIQQARESLLYYYIRPIHDDVFRKSTLQFAPAAAI